MAPKISDTNCWKLEILLFIAKGYLQMQLNSWSWDGEIILDYLGDLMAITSVLVKDRQKETAPRREGSVTNDAEWSPVVINEVY